MSDLSNLVTQFIDGVRSGHAEIYNEFSLQHELGICLRRLIPASKVQFERNVSFFFRSKFSFSKRELDLSVYSDDKANLQIAIELKFPRNGQYPEQMFSFCKDIAFAEELKNAGFSTAALVIFADDPLFYRGPSDGIYAYFRGGVPLHGAIQKPTGAKDTQVHIAGTYTVRWSHVAGSLMYALVEV